MELGGVHSLPSADCSPQGQASADHVLIGVSPLFQQVLKVVDSVACNDSVVLLEGESGTGKELLARRVHHKSTRTNGPFIPVNCPGITETLFESQFYGHIRGAFTGATTDTLGVVRAAQGGTLLLDEIGELPLHLQPKLLRLLQEWEITPVGASKPISVNARFIASTNCNLAKNVSEGSFRGDLYHRLNIVRIVVPPLRSRPEDIEPLLNFYLNYYCQHYQMSIRVLSLRLRGRLQEYPWPGNVRELRSYIERLYAANLPPMPPTQSMWDEDYHSPVRPIEPTPGRMPPVDATPVCCTLAEAEAKAIQHALSTTGFNRSAAARLLNIHRSTLLRKMRLFGMD